LRTDLLLEIALAVRRHAEQNQLIAESISKSLIVRVELAFNYALHVASPAACCESAGLGQRGPCGSTPDRREPAMLRAVRHRQTHDELWNACQREMLLRGKIHATTALYWGKKIIEWSRTLPGTALETMLRIHDRYALDGRDPNTLCEHPVVLRPA